MQPVGERPRGGRLHRGQLLGQPAERAIGQDEQARRLRGRHGRVARRAGEQRHLAEEPAGADRVDHRAVASHLDRAGRHDDELVRVRALPHELHPGRHVDQVGRLGDRLELVVVAMREERHRPDQLDLRILVRHRTILTPGRMRRSLVLTSFVRQASQQECAKTRLYWPGFMANDILEEQDQQGAEPGVWTIGPNGERVPDYDSTFPTINEGEVVHGCVVRVDKDEVLVDIGYKSEGVIPVAELSIRRSVNPQDEVKVGEEIDALVLTKEDAEGRLILSKKRARFELAWKRIEGAAESGEPVEGKVIEVVKGGLILDLGVRGFLPASLVDIRRVQDLDEYLGQELRCKVIELNRSRNNVVLSRRAVLEDERKEMRQAILDRLNPGDVVKGTISNIVDFGAFVDLDGMDGLIHISELSWSHVNHPSEVLEIGQEVDVKVL